MKDAKGHGSNTRGGIGATVGHMAGVLAAAAKRFPKNESGEGKLLNHEGVAHYFQHELPTKPIDPEAAARLAPEVHEQLLEGGLPHLGTLIHLAHFLGFLGAIAVVTELLHIVGFWS